MFTPERSEPLHRLPRSSEQERRPATTSVLGLGTLACPDCDAPVGIGAEPLSPRSPLICPFCAHHGPLREFLSMAAPARPTRVVVRITAPTRLRISPAD